MENPIKMNDLEVSLFSEISIWVKSATLQAMVDQNLFLWQNPTKWAQNHQKYKKGKTNSMCRGYNPS